MRLVGWFYCSRGIMTHMVERAPSSRRSASTSADTAPATTITANMTMPSRHSFDSRAAAFGAGDGVGQAMAGPLSP